MNQYIVGIDPDSDEHGVALYKDGHLVELKNLSLLGVYYLLTDLCCQGSVLVSMEDNDSISAIYSGRIKSKDNAAVAAKKAQHVGMCKQAQREIERVCSRLDIRLLKQKPSKRWKSQYEKPLFTKTTGWLNRSNEDTRSAAYMGYLAMNKFQ